MKYGFSLVLYIQQHLEPIPFCPAIFKARVLLLLHLEIFNAYVLMYNTPSQCILFYGTLQLTYLTFTAYQDMGRQQLLSNVCLGHPLYLPPTVPHFLYMHVCYEAPSLAILQSSSCSVDSMLGPVMLDVGLRSMWPSLLFNSISMASCFVCCHSFTLLMQTQEVRSLCCNACNIVIACQTQDLSTGKK